MKHNYYQFIKNLTLILALVFGLAGVQAQEILFTFANAQNTNDGVDDFYEVDVMIQSTVDFKLGSGQLYFNYNSEAFGTNIDGDASAMPPAPDVAEYTQPSGSITGVTLFGGALNVYNGFVDNNNTSTRYSVSFQQGVNASLMDAQSDVTSTPKLLLHLKIKYQDITKDPMFTFEEAALFGGQFVIACEGVPCSGTVISAANDTFDSSGAEIDTTPPVITLTGANPQTIELGAGYTELGATADDGSSVVIDASAFMDAVGSYTITYNATDGSGNNAVEVTRTVNVVDTTAPVITLNGANPQTIELGAGYSELGATADDGSAVVIDASAFMDAIGSYMVTYNATDTAGNDAVEVTRTVNVVDTTAPVITLNGANPQTIELGAGYTELGATADDGSSVVIDASAFMDAVGSYTVTYNATDGSGNDAVEVTRTVNVVDTTAPVITLNGANPQTIELGAGYTELGATTDDGSAVVIDASAFIDAVGSYSVTYNATDASGNDAVEVTRTVNVVDTTAPVITLNGANPQTIELGAGYMELGATTDDGSAVVIDASAFMDAVGSYSVTYNATDASGNDAVEVTRTVNVVDTTAPVITLNGANPQAIEQGNSYVELGATTDDGSMVMIDASAVNTNMAGSYIVTYNATDASGNNAVEVTRTINVTDTTAPIISLNGLPIVVAEAANPYVDAGATATDAVDGSLTASIVVVNPVNVLMPGTYTVTYNVSDAAGNAAAQVTRTVIVQDNTVPVITLLGSTTVTVEAGSTYTDAGATASDSLDGDITADIVVVNPVNTSILGTYTVTYNVEDASSNSAVEVTRTVNVVDTTAPVITLNGSNPQTIELGAGYTELGATTDDGSAVVIDASAFADAVGSYTITYNAADASGNDAVEVSRTVNVVDTTAPVITLNGSNPQIISEGGMYTELGATTDDGSMVVIDASAVNINAVGSYTVTYNATDASGNAAVEVTRTVNVVDTNAPIITLNGANPQAIELGASYVELGATADDGSTVVIDASAVNTNVLGSYNVTYNTTDAAGNAAVEVVRIVNVVDTTAPVITLNGANPQTIELGAGYTELGATTDDGSMVVIDASAVNTNAVGSYTVTYNATDASGNAAVEVTRTVNVVDTTAPVITLNGSNPQIIAQGDVYAELGATTDDGSIVVIEASAVNTNAIGSYSVTYNATDASGNAAVEVIRTVNVVDTNAPIITLSGANPQIIELGTAYVELGATTNDGSMVVIDASAVNTNAIGSYSVTYNATDASGNAAVEVIRTVNVVDTNAPVITLTGANPQTIELGTAYVELGATTNDGSMVVIDASAVNTNAIGTYSVTYNATDASGNNAVEVIRTVNVVDTTAPVITLNGANPQEILEGTAYVELGATTDDGSMVVIDASAVDTNVIGSYTVTYNATDASGNAAVEVTRTVNVTATLSVDENELASIILYPNPVIDRFVVSGVSETIDMIEIYSMEGRLVKQIKDYNDQAIEVSQFQEGVYLVRISKGNSSKTIQFVKKK